MVAKGIRERVPKAQIEGVATGSPEDLRRALQGRDLIFAAGAAGAVLLPKAARSACPGLRVVIDLNAVPPLGVEGVEPADAGVERDGVVGYGALGIGATKMKLQKAAIVRLFEKNDFVLDAEQVFELARQF